MAKKRKIFRIAEQKKEKVTVVLSVWLNLTNCAIEKLFYKCHVIFLIYYMQYTVLYNVLEEQEEKMLAS